MGVCFGKPKELGHPAIGALVPESRAKYTDHYDIVAPITQSGCYNLYLLRQRNDTSARAQSSPRTGGEQLYALKEMNKMVVDRTKLREFKTEIEALKQLDHPNIVRAHSIYEDNNYLSVIMTNCAGGDLTNRGPYPEDDAGKVIMQIVEGVNHLHLRGIIHRDLKMENVMFTMKNEEEFSIKIIDFGLSTNFTPGQTFNKKTGTAYTIAPEVLNGEYTEKCDMWSVGVIAYQLLSGRRPFWSTNTNELIRQVMRGTWSFQGEAWDDVSDSAKDFIAKLLEVDPAKRMSAEEALSHPWIKVLRTGRTIEYNDKVLQSIESFVDYSAFRKLALQIVAYIEPESVVLRLRRLFLAADKSHTGVITREEFREVLETTGKYSDKEIDRWFDSIDMYNTGRIDYNVFIAATLEAESQISESSLARAFERLDIDQSGDITRDNLRKVLGEKISDHAIDEMMIEAGIKDKGSISYSDFRRICTESPRQLSRRLSSDVARRLSVEVPKGVARRFSTELQMPQ